MYIEVAIGPVTGRVLQSYRSGSHMKLLFRSTCTVLQTSGNVIK